MARAPSTDINGRPFAQTTIGAVWRKGRVIATHDSNVWRHDMCGQVMKFDEYGKVNSKFGWEVDHVKPVTRDGTDDIANLQPLQWEDNRRKGDTFPWNC